MFLPEPLCSGIVIEKRFSIAFRKRRTVTARTIKHRFRSRWPGTLLGAGLLLTLLILLGLPAFSTLHGASHHVHGQVSHVHGGGHGAHRHDQVHDPAHDQTHRHASDHDRHRVPGDEPGDDEPSHDDDTCAICVELLIAKTLGTLAVLSAAIVQETLVDRPIVPTVVRAPTVDRPRSACTRGPPCTITAQA
jgi:hypothetical protein